MPARPRPRFEIRFASRAERSLLALDARTRRQVASRIDGLAVDPRPRGAKKLSGEEDLYRLRVGDLRVLYAIRDQELIVLVVAIGPRRDIYRRL